MKLISQIAIIAKVAKIAVLPFNSRILNLSVIASTKKVNEKTIKTIQNQVRSAVN